MTSKYKGNQSHTLQLQKRLCNVCRFGKSDVTMMITSMCLGVAIMLVPLLDLGSDQVLKAWKFERNIEVYHLDECHCDCEDCDKLRKHFQSMHDEEQEHVLIFLAISTGFAKELYIVKCDKGIRNEGVDLHLLHCRGPRIEQQGQNFWPSLFRRWKYQQTVLHLMHCSLMHVCLIILSTAW